MLCRVSPELDKEAMSIESDLTPENVKNPQRRTIMKAAAWAAPVVAIAATAPLAAASLTTGFSSITTGTTVVGDHHNGFVGNTSTFSFVFDNSGGDSGWVTLGLMIPAGYEVRDSSGGQLSGGTLGNWTYTGSGSEIIFRQAGITVSTGGIHTIPFPGVQIVRVDPGAASISADNRITVKERTENVPAMNRDSTFPTS